MSAEPAPAPHETSVVDVSFGPRQRRTFDGCVLAVFVLGLVLIGSQIGQEERSTLAVGVGVGLLVVVGMLFRARSSSFRHRRLEVDRSGVRLIDTTSRAFSVLWTELAQVRVSYARKPTPLRTPLTWGRISDDAPPGESPKPRWGVSTLVRLDLVPADAGFLDRHPDLKAYKRYTERPRRAGPGDAAPWVEDLGTREAILRIPFSNVPELIGPVDQALAAHAGTRYHAPVNEGLALGFRYS